MKKLRNEKGFAMAELLAVCIIVLGIFAVLFSNYLPLTAEYENRVTYNNVNAEYAATYIRKAFKDVKVGSLVKDLDKKTYYTLYAGGSLNVGNVFNDKENKNKLSQINKMIEQYGIQEIIITKFKTSEVKDEKNGGYKNGDGLLYNYIKYLPTFKDYKVTKTGKYRIILKTKDYGYATVPLRYAEPNEPKLDNDMLPVYFDGTTIKVADKTNESVTKGWYDYVEKKWANVVKLNSSKNVSDYVAGDKVDPGDIKTMWVWIPKYKYEEFNSKNPKQINITFITQDNEKDTPHPAFGTAKSDTTGFWIGKYEGSEGDKIVAGATSRAKSAVGNVDITNQEWGAVGYLAYSRYGTCSYDNDSEKAVCAGVNKNSDFKTGGDEKRSTTRNMYGVFDMNGGRFEIVNGADKKGNGTGSTLNTDSELKKRGSTTYEKLYGKKYFHKFNHKGGCAICCPRCHSCGSGDDYDPCCWVSYYKCGSKNCEQDTNKAYTQDCDYSTGAPVNVYEKEDVRSADGVLYYNWKNNTYADDCLSADSGNLNLRGGFAKGNAFCIKTTETMTGTIEKQSEYVYADKIPGNKHYSIAEDYNGIFSYSSSEYVRQEYITHRSVIKK